MPWNLNNSNTKSYQAFVFWPEFLTPDECKKIISLQASQQATVGKGVTHPVRESNITWLRPVEYFPGLPVAANNPNWIFQKLDDYVSQINDKHFRFVLSSIQDLQLTEYEASYFGHYGQHADCTYGMNLNENKLRKLSISIQLSDTNDYEGGDLILYPSSFGEPFVAPRDQGTLVVFRS